LTEYGVTNVHPLALLATLLAGGLLLGGQRSRAILAIALVACLIPLAQRVVVASLDFNMVRILILIGWIRLLARGEIRPLRLNEIDVAFLGWVLVASGLYVIREGTMGAFVYRLGMTFDALGVYFLFRMLLRRPEDSVQAVRYFAICAALVMGPMIVEWATGHNVFAVFGGVPLLTMIRDGRLRCQGAFSHPIMAGSFGATLVPIFVGMYLAFPRARLLALVGAISGTVIAIAAASSGAVISLAAGLGAIALWPVRRYTRTLLWGTVALLAVLHVVREMPVWHLIARVSNLMGGEGHHRYLLIDAFLNRWSEWFLLGTPSTAHWGPILWDTTNQYVTEGVTGGILALVSFCVLLTVSFRAMGSASRSGKLGGRSPRAQDLWCWGIGCGLFAHAMGFISVSYFGQMQVLFYLFLAVIAAEYSFVLAARRSRAKSVAQPKSRLAPATPGAHSAPALHEPQ
jgi:hypothetical protein